MTGILSQTCAWLLMKQLWLVAVVFVLLGTSTTTGPTTENGKPSTLLTTKSVLNETTEPQSIIPHVNVTAVTDWIKDHKKQAAIGLIIGVAIAMLIIIFICCCISKFAVAKIKRNKKKKGGALRGYFKNFKLPKFKMPKLKLFKVQPKGGFGKEIKNIGSLKFSLFYEKKTGELYINVKSAENLSLKSSAFVSFNFVQVELDPFSVATSAMGERCETKRVRNSICPVFNDVIIIKILPRDLKEQTLLCYVFDENRLSPRDFIGVVTLELHSHVKNISGLEKDFEETLEWRKGGRGGDILLSFRWNPRDEIFFVTVKECSNLAAIDGKGSSNPYVKVEAFDGPDRFFQETTDTKSKTLFPVFNEIFQFSLANQQKKTVCLIISVKHRPSWNGKKSIIGQLSFSFRSIGEELSHWRTTLSSGKDVAMMHNLRAAVEMPRKHGKLSLGEEIVDVLSDEENLSENEDDRLL